MTTIGTFGLGPVPNTSDPNRNFMVQDEVLGYVSVAELMTSRSGRLLRVRFGDEEEQPLYADEIVATARKLDYSGTIHTGLYAKEGAGV